MAWSTKNWISIAKTTSVHLIFIKEKKKAYLIIAVFQKNDLKDTFFLILPVEPVEGRTECLGLVIIEPLHNCIYRIVL